MTRVREMARQWRVVLLVLALLTLGGLTHAGRRGVEREIAAGTFRLTPRSLLHGLRAYLTNEDDMQRCHSYAQAILGRPYRSYYLHTRAEWEPIFARGIHLDPDETPMVEPSAPLRPYRDFLLEYPPGFLLVLIPPALVAHGEDGYALGFKLEMAASLLLAVWIALRLAREAGVAAEDQRRIPTLFGLAILAIGVVATHRYDAFVAMCMLAAVLAAVRGRAGLAGLILGVSVAAKGVPLLLAPLLALFVYERARDWRPAARFVGALVAVAGGALAAAYAAYGPGVLEAFAYHRDRPVQIESTPGALLAAGTWFRPGFVTVVHSFSSRNLRGPAVDAVGGVANAVTVLALLSMVVWLLVRLRAERDPQTRLWTIFDGAVILLAGYVTLGKVFCPQYLVWPLPFAVLSSLRPGRGVARRRAGLALLVATQIIYPIAYGGVKALAPWATALVLARNVGVLVWAASLLRTAPVNAAATVGVDGAAAGAWTTPRPSEASCRDSGVASL
jgi:hypothetical protein